MFAILFFLRCFAKLIIIWLSLKTFTSKRKQTKPSSLHFLTFLTLPQLRILYLYSVKRFNTRKVYWRWCLLIMHTDTDYLFIFYYSYLDFPPNNPCNATCCHYLFSSVFLRTGFPKTLKQVQWYSANTYVNLKHELKIFLLFHKKKNYKRNRIRLEQTFSTEILKTN